MLKFLISRWICWCFPCDHHLRACCSLDSLLRFRSLSYHLLATLPQLCSFLTSSTHWHYLSELNMASKLYGICKFTGICKVRSDRYFHRLYETLKNISQKPINPLLLKWDLFSSHGSTAILLQVKNSIWRHLSNLHTIWRNQQYLPHP